MNALFLMNAYLIVSTGEDVCREQSTGYIMIGLGIMATLGVDIAVKQIANDKILQIRTAGIIRDLFETKGH